MSASAPGFDVLNAQATVIDAKIKQINVEHDVVVASYRILQAIGHLSAERLDLQVTKYKPGTLQGCQG
ncbi:outer membrane protein TolC [Mesorhizobium sangaii]|uniref:Outer membrane protein TolC n=1 Tax=Mesorhizobium sangaii TaxID=505389 RepID=A0A841PFL7_9HYPH|nr:hypothetical protein [Mesorhizobium sangaii]MBB6413946.1 outer membrane protein TolC [Mesorhizobium sangaii]